MRKIRFALGLRDFSKKKGGAERYLVDLCTRMAAEGYEVHVYAEHWDKGSPEIHFHQVKTIPFPKSLRLLSFAIRATREMEKADYDITLGAGNTIKADVLQPHGGVHWAWFWRSLKAYDPPISWTIKFLGRILSPKQWISGYIEDAPYKGKKYYKIIAISDMVKQDMIRWYGIPEDRIAVVYNGIDIERFSPRNRQYREEILKRHGIGDEFVILFVSNNFRMKGLNHLIRALADIKEEDSTIFSCLVLGKDKRGSYIRLAKKLGVSDRIFFAGLTDEPEKYYGAVDLLVHPTFYDACSLTVLEALASGLPVVTTIFNGASGVVDHLKEGWVMRDPSNVNELKMAIQFFSKEDRRQCALCQGRDKRRVYSRSSNFNQMVGIFKEVIERSDGYHQED